MRSPSFFLSFFALQLVVNGARVHHNTTSSTSSTTVSFFSPLPHVQNLASTSSSFPSSSSNSPSSSASSTLFSSSSGTSNPLPSSFTSSHATTSSSLPSLATTPTTVITEQSSSTSPSSIYATSVPSTFTAAPSPTLVVTTAYTTSIAGVITPTASTNASRDLSLSGFWSNKRTVVAIFTVVGLVVFALIGGAIFVLARQRGRDRELMAGEEFFDKHNSTAVDVMREPSIAPSMARETTHASTDVYMSRDVHFGSHYMQPTYGLDYPQGVAYGHVDEQPTQATNGQGNSSAYLLPQPFVSAPPISYRQPRGRAPGTYKPSSIDSFYGGIEEK